MLVELQHFDLAGPVIPDMPYLEPVYPILMLWHNHDLDRVKTQGLVFETRVGQGRPLVSALNHSAKSNSAGRWMLGALLRHLDPTHQPERGMAPTTIARLRESIGAKKIELVDAQWVFKPDGENKGLSRRWHMPVTAMDESWDSSRIGVAWEGQGHGSLDG